MSESMVTRVAKALADHHDDGLNFIDYYPSARAAIEAMRVPTRPMVERGSIRQHDWEACENMADVYALFRRQWGNALDAALEDGNDIRTIHHWFGLTRSAYFVMPRIAMEAMPAAWQRAFIALMDEAEALGLETPSYHVLRQEPEFTTTKRYNEDDETSRNFEYTAWSEDPWANYRHGDIKELCPSFRTQTPSE